MAGFDVSRGLLDQRSAEAVLAVRGAFDIVEAITAFLATVPADAPGGDKLTRPQVPPVDENGQPTAEPGFGYTADEAYLIRVTFEALHAARQSIAGTLDAARQLTGLQ